MAARFLEQLESDRVDVVAAALEGGAIERYLDQMEAGNTQVIIRIETHHFRNAGHILFRKNKV